MPPESSTVTTGCALKATPLLELPATCLNTSWVAAPVEIVMLVEAADVKPSPVKVRV